MQPGTPRLHGGLGLREDPQRCEVGAARGPQDVTMGEALCPSLPVPSSVEGLLLGGVPGTRLRMSALVPCK